MTVISITGKNTFLAAQKLEELRSEFEKEYGTTNLSTLSADDAEFDDISEKLFAQGLFSTNSMLILKDISKNSYLQDKILENLEKFPEESLFVIYEPEIDKRSKFFKKIKTDTAFNDFAPLDEFALADWAGTEASKIGLEIDRSQISTLVKRVNLDQWAVFNELQKLRNLGRKITAKDIEEMVDESFTETIFNLLDKAFSKDSKGALKMYDEMRENRVEPHYILSMIAWQLHILITVAYGAGMSGDQIAKQAKISPFVVRKSQSALSKTSKTELLKVIDFAAKVDYESKTDSSVDVDASTSLLIAKIAAQ